MKKTHSKPEFAVIKLDQNNRKFFVASGSEPEPTPTGGTLGSMSITENEEPW